MFLIVGLGNPGEEYEKSRHNVGFMVIDRLSARLGIALNATERESIWGESTAGARSLVLAKPLTYVNLSGQSTVELLRRFNTVPADLIVIHDDLDLPRGKIKLKREGGSGGHNGLKSIISCLGSRDFGRVRIGIGRPAGRQDPARFVLAPFTKRQWTEMDIALEQAAEAILAIISNGFEQAMNKFNKSLEIK